MPELVALFDIVGYRTAAGDTFYASKGETFEVDDEQAERHLNLGSACYPGQEPSGEPEPAADAQALAKAHSRDELDELAFEAGVEDYAELPNKTAVAEAILAARAASGEPEPAADAA